MILNLKKWRRLLVARNIILQECFLSLRELRCRSISAKDVLPLQHLSLLVVIKELLILRLNMGIALRILLHQSLHGVTPSEARNNRQSLKAYPRMTFQLSIKGGNEMNYRIEEKEAFRIVGIKKRVPIIF